MEGFIFDLDGTLINSLEDIANSMNRALEAYKLPIHPVEAYKYFVGNGAEKLALRAVGKKEELFQEVFKLYMKDYKENNLVKTAPYEGVMETLKTLKEKGFSLGVFSNKPHQDTIAIVEHFFPNIPFKAVRGQTKEVPVKPNPKGAWLVAEEMEISPEKMIYVGDSGVDMICANRAKMFPVGAAWGFRTQEELEENGAKKIIHTPLELLRMMEEQ